MGDTGRLIAVVLLASFAIERVAATVDFFATAATEKQRKLLRVGLSGLIALAVVAFTGIRILAAMKFNSPNTWVDFLLTWLILVGGADKIGQFLGTGSAGAVPAAKKEEIRPVQIIIDKTDVTKDALQLR